MQTPTDTALPVARTGISAIVGADAPPGIAPGAQPIDSGVDAVVHHDRRRHRASGAVPRRTGAARRAPRVCGTPDAPRTPGRRPVGQFRYLSMNCAYRSRGSPSDTSDMRSTVRPR